MRLLRPLLLLALLLPLAACGLLREPEEASAPIEAVPLIVETTAAPTLVPDDATAQPEATSAADIAAPATGSQSQQPLPRRPASCASTVSTRMRARCASSWERTCAGSAQRLSA